MLLSALSLLSPLGLGELVLSYCLLSWAEQWVPIYLLYYYAGKNRCVHLSAKRRWQGTRAVFS